MHAPYKYCIKYARTCISCIRFAYMHMCHGVLNNRSYRSSVAQLCGGSITWLLFCQLKVSNIRRFWWSYNDIRNKKKKTILEVFKSPLQNGYSEKLKCLLTNDIRFLHNCYAFFPVKLWIEKVKKKYNWRNFFIWWLIDGRWLVPSCNPNYHSRSGSIAPRRQKISCCLRTKKNVLLGWMLFHLRGKLTRKIIPIRNTLAKLLFLCNSVEEGQGETKRSALCLARSSAYTLFQLMSCASPKQRLKARPHGRAKLTEQRDLLASWRTRAREIISKSFSRLSELCFPTGEPCFPTGWSYAETPASCACCSANFILSCRRCSELCSWTLIAKVSVEWNSEIRAKNRTKSQLHSISSWYQGQWNLS